MSVHICWRNRSEKEKKMWITSSLTLRHERRMQRKNQRLETEKKSWGKPWGKPWVKSKKWNKCCFIDEIQSEHKVVLFSTQKCNKSETKWITYLCIGLMLFRDWYLKYFLSLQFFLALHINLNVFYMQFFLHFFSIV